MIISKSKSIMEDKFNFWIPIDIEKAKGSKEKSTGTDDDSRYDNMVFEGVASDSSEDDEGESIGQVFEKRAVKFRSPNITIEGE